MPRLDVVIFGATGFTGKHVVEETVRISKNVMLTWGIAGRSQKKLETLIEGLSKKTGENLSSVKIIVADINDEQSLKAMTSQTKIIVNCCGPYCQYGEQVVKTCINTKTHHLDLSAEQQFTETMQVLYDKAARDAGVYIISSCGFDCIPNDMGVIFLQQNFGGILNSVESYVDPDVPITWQTVVAVARHGIVNYGTWVSLLCSLAHDSELPPLRKKLYPERQYTFKPELQKRCIFHKKGEAWCTPYPGIDDSVVYRTQRYFYEVENKRSVQFKSYLKFRCFLRFILAIMLGTFLYMMTRTKFTTKILLDYPRICSLGLLSRDGPEEIVMNNTVFAFELHGMGWDASVTDIESTPPKKKVVAKVSGVNPGYGATVTALMFCAITILKEKDRMPSGGGVLTTGAAFSKTNLIKNLNGNNLIFEIVNSD